MITVLVDPEPILVTLGATPDPTQGLTHSGLHSHIHTYGQFSVVGLPVCIFLDSGSKPENPEKTYVNVGKQDTPLLCFQ